MSKEKNRGHREAKKPKKVQPKVLATATTGHKSDPTIAGKKVK